MPGVVVHGVVKSAANIDESWIYTDAVTMFRDKLHRDVVVVNDADAAGLAEVRYGAARDQDGLVIITTLGTGIGTALVYDGVLVPNSELGHLEIDGKDAEAVAANSVREKKDLSWSEWAERLTTYYRTLERLFSPELFVVGGGVSKHADKFLPLLGIDTRIVPATLRNTAGIVGAAVLAAESAERPLTQTVRQRAGRDRLLADRPLIASTASVRLRAPSASSTARTSRSTVRADSSSCRAIDLVLLADRQQPRHPELARGQQRLLARAEHRDGQRQRALPQLQHQHHQVAGGRCSHAVGSPSAVSRPSMTTRSSSSTTPRRNTGPIRGVRVRSRAAAG